MRLNILRVMEYFKRGHTAYFSFFIQIVNFINILFVLLITLSVLRSSVLDYIVLLLIMIFCYVPSVIVLGKWDYNRGAFIAFSKIVREKSPIYREIFEQLRRIEEVLDHK